MKNLKKISVLIIFSLLANSCKNEIDNYPAPNGGIIGTIYDMDTNQPIPLPVQGGSGTMVSLFEQNTNATASIDFRANQDGTFVNSKVFNGYYRVYVNGPFVGVCEGFITINGQTQFDLRAIPFSRISAEATISEDNKINVSYQVEKADPSFTLTEIDVMWNFAPGVDINSSNYAAINVKDNQPNGTHVFDLLASKIFAENHYKIQANKNKVYIRVAAKVNNVINYSKVLELIVH